MTMTAEELAEAVIQSNKKPPTAKDKLIIRLNELRTAADMPPYDPAKVKMTTDEMNKAIHVLETPHKPEAPTPPKTSDLLRKLNVINTHLDLPRLKAWKGTRKALEDLINKRSLDPRALHIKHIPAAVAAGARTRRPINTSKMEKGIKRMDKQEKRKMLNEQKDTAKKIAVAHGFTATTVLSYMQSKGITRPQVAGSALADDIRAYIAQCDKLGLKTSQKRSQEAPKDGVQRQKRSTGHVTPGDIAIALSKPPRAVRIILRRIEKTIPKAWRVKDERWGFNEANKADIIKLVKGK